MADEDQIDDGNDSVRQGKIPDDVLRIIRAAKGKPLDEDIPATTFDMTKVFPVSAAAAQAEEQAIKYELSDKTTTLNDGTVLYRIRALKNIYTIGVRAGDLGGFVESTDNLSQEGIAWISVSAKVWDNAYISGNAQVYGNGKVYGDAQVSGNTWVSGSMSGGTVTLTVFRRYQDSFLISRSPHFNGLA